MKAVISMKGKSFQKEIDGNLLYGKKIGDVIQGGSLGLENYELQITGGSDKQGFPMRKGVVGITRKKIVLSGGVGYKSEGKGIRRRKSIRGEIISEEIAQINLKVLKEGQKKFEEFLDKKSSEEKEKSEEKK
ncbi:MAG: 30S ribosomal protein S6e [Candidatus Aenigmarchaeota archaeon]|nr:30S ribosomal protein S6e [Candidatus Aenigmarchaeota archaeon]